MLPYNTSRVDSLSWAVRFSEHPRCNLRGSCKLWKSWWFLSRVSILLLTRDIDIVILSVRLSIRHTLVLYESGLTYHHSFSTIRFYGHQTSSRNSDGVTPRGAAKYRWGIKNLRFPTNKSLYLAKDTRYRHGYYGRRIGNRTQAFE